MKQYTEFEKDESSGTIVARSSNPMVSAVRFEMGFADWADEDSGNWEDLMEYLLEELLGDELTIDDDGNAVISVESATAAIAGSPHATDEQSARAVIDYLDEEDILGIEGETVTVLRPPHTYEEGQMDQAVRMYSNWAAAFDTLVGRIGTAVERVKDAQERLDSRSEETTDVSDHLHDLRSKREEYQQEMLSIAGDRDVEELTEEEQRRFDHAREQYYHYDNLLTQGENGDTIPDPNPQQMDLGEVIEQLESTKVSFEVEQDRLRTRIRTQQLWPTKELEASEQFTNVLSAMGNIVPKKERMEEESGQNLLDQLRGSSEDLSQLDNSTRAMQETGREESERDILKES